MGSLRNREVACSASDHQGSNPVSGGGAVPSHNPLEVLLAQFSLYVHKLRWPKTLFIHSLPLPLAAGSSMVLSLWFCSPGSLSPGEISLVLPCEWQLRYVEFKSHENSYYNYIITPAPMWLEWFIHIFLLNRTCGTFFRQSKPWPRFIR